MEIAGLKFVFVGLRVRKLNRVHEGISIPTELWDPYDTELSKIYSVCYALGIETQTHRCTQLYIFPLQHSILWYHETTADLFPEPKKHMKGFFLLLRFLFFFFLLESILLISWYKSLHCGTLSNMNLSFLSRGRAFQPCEKEPHCGGPETPEFLAAGKRDLWGKERLCRPDLKPRHFSQAGRGLYCC